MLQLKAHEKTQAEHQNEIKQITNKAIFQLSEEINRIKRFSVDLKPLDEKMKNLLLKFKKHQKKQKKSSTLLCLE